MKIITLSRDIENEENIEVRFSIIWEHQVSRETPPVDLRHSDDGGKTFSASRIMR